MGKSKDKSVTVLANKYDQYEVQFAFNELANQVLAAKFKPNNGIFFVKVFLGILLTINIYLSHWYPLAWPLNYNLIVGCVIFYYTASYYYESLDILKKHEGGFIGQYRINDNESRKYILKFTLYNNVYTLCQLDHSTHKVIKEVAFNYNDYLTENGTILAQEFKKQVVGKLLA